MRARPPSIRKKGEVSLERALSKLGIASRTQANRLIQEGRVRVNGVLRTHPGFPVHPESARIEVDGKKEDAREFVAYVLHKTKGTVTTRSDERGRPTVFSLLPASPHLSPVGRLDLATTGLLILTNHTQLAAWLTDPENAIPRVYIVEVRGEVLPETAQALVRGRLIEGENYRASRVEILKASGKESRLKVELREGKNREIRKLFLAFGHEVTSLKRVRFGGLELGDLQLGQYRSLSPEELRHAFPGCPLDRPPAPSIRD